MTLKEPSAEYSTNAHAALQETISRSPDMSTLKKVKSHSFGANDTGNSIIQGDNLDVLKFLAKDHSGRVRCIYLDPPYNNGDTYRHYDDRMTHEEWLTSVATRLEQAKDLLSDDGSLWISIDDSEVHYLKVAADSIFGRQNFVSTIIWERRTTRENRKVFSRNHEYLLVYSKNKVTWTKTRNSLAAPEEVKNRYKNPDADPRGPWQSVTANVQDGHATAQQFYSIKAPSGRIHSPPNGRCWVYSKARMLEEIANNNIWFGKDGNGVPRIKKFLSASNQGVTPETLWRASEVGTTTSAKKHLIELFGTDPLFDTPKPEQLIQRILEISTNPGDLVVDPYLGSGTTAATAHKMGRRYIGIEKGEHIKSHCVQRLKKVVSGESGGASPPLNWTGGGGFTFFKFQE